jgi:hypothetical protein
MRCPFTLYKEKTKSGFVWYARFWDAEVKKYSQSRSTGIPVEGKREHRKKAEDVARTMLSSIRFTHGKPKITEKFFARYVEDFWTPESSYVKECAIVKKKPLSAYYVMMHHDDVRRHVETMIYIPTGSDMNRLGITGI